MRIDLQAFLEGAAQTGIGMLQGRMAGEELVRQRQQQEYTQLLQAAQARQQQEEARRRGVLGILPQLAPESQEAAIQYGLSEPDVYGPVREHRYVQQRPDLMRMYGPPRGVQPALTPGAVPGAQPGIRVAGIPQPLKLKGYDPKEATRVMGLMDKALGDLRSIRLTDPRQIEARDEYFRQRTALGTINTPEKLQQSNTLLQGLLNFQSAVGGPVVQAAQRAELQTDVTGFEQEFEKGNVGLSDIAFAGTLPGWLQREESLRGRYGGRGYGGKGLWTEKRTITDIEQALAMGDQETAARLGREVRGRLQSKVSAQQEQQGVAAITRIIGGWAPQQATPENVRNLYQTYDKGKYAYLVEGVPDELLQAGGSALEKQWEKAFGLLTNPARWKNAPPEVRKAALAEVQGIATQTGRKITLPADYIFEMDAETRLRLAQRGTQLELQGGQLAVARARLRLDKEKFAYAKAHPEAAGGKASILTQNAKARQLHDFWMEASNDLNRALRSAKLSKIDFDIERPDPKDEDQVAAGKLYQEVKRREAALKTFLRKQGLDVDTGLTVPIEADKSGATPGPPAGAAPRPSGQRAGVSPPPGGQRGAAAPPIIRPFQEGVSVRGTILDQQRSRLESDGKSLDRLKASIDARNPQAAQGRLTAEQVARLRTDVDRYNASLPVYQRNQQLYNAGAQSMNAAAGAGGGAARGGAPAAGRNRFGNPIQSNTWRLKYIQDLQAQGVPADEARREAGRYAPDPRR